MQNHLGQASGPLGEVYQHRSLWLKGSFPRRRARKGLLHALHGFGRVIHRGSWTVWTILWGQTRTLALGGVHLPGTMLLYGRDGDDAFDVGGFTR